MRAACTEMMKMMATHPGVERRSRATLIDVSLRLSSQAVGQALELHGRDLEVLDLGGCRGLSSGLTAAAVGQRCKSLVTLDLSGPFGEADTGAGRGRGRPGLPDAGSSSVFRPPGVGYRSESLLFQVRSCVGVGVKRPSRAEATKPVIRRIFCYRGGGVAIIQELGGGCGIHPPVVLTAAMVSSIHMELAGAAF